MQAKEFGLLANREFPKEEWTPEDYIRILRQIPPAVDKKGLPNIPEGSTSKITDRIADLKDKEIELSGKIERLRSKQLIIKRVSTTNGHFTDSILSQHERLASVGWFKRNLRKQVECPFCGAETPSHKNYLKLLLDASKELEQKAAKANDTRIIFDNEILKTNQELGRLESAINVVRDELKRLLRDDDAYKQNSQTTYAIYRFIGELESKLNSYDSLRHDSIINKKLSAISQRIAELEELVDVSQIKQKEKNALRRIETSIGHYSKIFQAERSDDPVRLNVTDLTLNFSNESGRDDALWEIGSGSNYMAYHISTILALHELFLRDKKHPVPSFIFFDQPSQAYFPEMKIRKEEQISGEDIERVQRIFRVLSDAIIRTEKKLQIIVLEHAGPSIWKDFPEVHMVARWRNDELEKALIPEDWIQTKHV